mgnify:CR=1 FL=1
MSESAFSLSKTGLTCCWTELVKQTHLTYITYLNREYSIVYKTTVTCIADTQYMYIYVTLGYF